VLSHRLKALRRLQQLIGYFADHALPGWTDSFHAGSEINRRAQDGVVHPLRAADISNYGFATIDGNPQLQGFAQGATGVESLEPVEHSFGGCDGTFGVIRLRFRSAKKMP
jgi:hypothetical protein